MKNIRQYLMAGIALLTLTACPSEEESETQSYTQSVTLPSAASEQEITLNQLQSSYVASIQNTAAWLTVSYSSGSTRVKLRSTANTERAERKCNVTITASSGDKVILSVTQQGVSEGAGIEDIHNSQTDQPAYRRR